MKSKLEKTDTFFKEFYYLEYNHIANEILKTI